METDTRLAEVEGRYMTAQYVDDFWEWHESLGIYDFLVDTILRSNEKPFVMARQSYYLEGYFMLDHNHSFHPQGWTG